ncbi:MAG: type II toxin-antitoxin system VapC family toxin [Candidatus Tectomicrobia bacterium]|nr:type II toxin-antitoxin system VapC family toxin [Candidatus Tectomicrobia bacterium]
MQEKVVLDTNIYIGIFNRGQYQDEINWLHKVTYLAHPVLHELWMGARGQAEQQHLRQFGQTFIRLGRLIRPEPATQIFIGHVCQKLRAAGHLDPKQPRHYMDVCIALLARQVGATVLTRDVDDFQRIREVIDFRFRDVTISASE